LRGEFHLLVFQQASHQFGTGVLDLLTICGFFTWQEHSRFDLDEHRGHQQVFGCELKVIRSDFFDVRQVLAGETRHRDIENVEVLLTDEVEQKIQGTFKGFQENLERVGRDV